MDTTLGFLIYALKGLEEGRAGGAGTRVMDQIEIRGNGGEAAIDRYWEALSDPSLPLSRAAEPISRIARIWQQAGRTGEALAMMRLAVRIEPANAGYYALLAQLFDASGEPEKALRIKGVRALLSCKAPEGCRNPFRKGL